MAVKRETKDLRELREEPVYIVSFRMTKAALNKQINK